MTTPALSTLGVERPTGCPFGIWLRRLPDDQRTEIERYLEAVRETIQLTPNASNAEHSYAELSRRMKAQGARWSHDQIRRHDRGFCTCP